MNTKLQPIAIVTGANGGIGKNYTRMMLNDGYRVVMAVRNKLAGELVREELLQSHPDAAIDVLTVDMGSLSSIKAFSKQVTEKYTRIDVLAHNAGVYFFDNKRRESADGIELNIAIHVVGPYVLTMHLLPRLKETQGSRVITMSSSEHHGAELDLSDLQMTEGFELRGNMIAYSRSKYAALALSHAMGRQFAADGLDIQVLAAHPGISITGIQHKGNPTFMQRCAIWICGKVLAATPTQAAKSLYMASTVGNMGEFYGPTGFKEMKGKAGLVQPDPGTLDKEVGASLMSQVAALGDIDCK
ncbi:SDR family NAD(P)-dependent oxidoreductase [uncultured Shewanella sp.]|uniref:SDR family NAD(P)-dependent oxidoreductase n=1 Tax=uncultured Shewanella sp. TaxID=173975 RepID=UPI00262DCA6C|nr:SDR family NAD(P)-dependent oxidoreductase [uncultured Shewanella sp.]